MISIWKYPVAPGRQTVEMPGGAELLSVQMQGDQPTLWARVDDQAAKVGRIISVVGTGHEAPHPKVPFIGTFQMGWMVWHVFDHGQQVHSQGSGQ